MEARDQETDRIALSKVVCVLLLCCFSTNRYPSLSEPEPMKFKISYKQKWMLVDITLAIHNAQHIHQTVHLMQNPLVYRAKLKKAGCTHVAD